MIDELRAAINDGPRLGERMNRIADEFRRGRDPNELMAALDSEVSEIASMAAWILGELPFDRYANDQLLIRLQSLTTHPDPLVRFHALGAIFPALRAGDPVTEDLLARLLGDPNKAVRASAERVRDRLIGHE